MSIDAVSVLAAGLTISRTATRLPGSTRPANTAPCRVIPAEPGPKLPLVAGRSMRSVVPISVAGSAELVRTLILTCSDLSPSMMSSAPRPVIESLPAPPSKMSPSPHTLPFASPTSGHTPVTEAAATEAADVVSMLGVTSAPSPAIRSMPRWSRALHPMNPAPPTLLGAIEVPLMTSLNADPESASVSCQRSRLTTTSIGTPFRLLLISMSSSAATVSYWWNAQSNPAAPALRSIPAFCAIRSSPPSAS